MRILGLVSGDTVVVNGVTYAIERKENEIHLRRYNEKYKMWVNVFFPADKTLDEHTLIDVLSEIYIKKHIADDENSESFGEQAPSTP